MRLAELERVKEGKGSKKNDLPGTNLTRVVENDDLSVERRGLLSWVVLGVGTDLHRS